MLCAHNTRIIREQWNSPVFNFQFNLQINYFRVIFLFFSLSLSLSICLNIYIYIYIYIYTVSDKPQKLVDNLTSLGSNISSTESDHKDSSLCLAKVWTVIDELSIIWKSDLSDKIKPWFLPKCGCVCTTVWMQHMDGYKIHWNKARWELNKRVTNYFKQIPDTTPHETTAVLPLDTHRKNHPSKTNKKCRTLLEKQDRIHEWLCSIDSHTWICQCWAINKDWFTSALCGHRM